MISTNPLIDLEASYIWSKRIINYLNLFFFLITNLFSNISVSIGEDSTSIKGYIRNGQCADVFGFLLLSAIQVKHLTIESEQKKTIF
jgi:hypothetical protein